MGSMITLKRFRVTNFRSVIDSDWIRAGSLTSFIGPNESGKSNLIEALYRIKPFDKKSKFDPDTDWPTDRWGERDLDTPACVAEFLFDQEEADALKQAAGLNVGLPTELIVRITRQHDNSYWIEWDNEPTDANWDAAVKHALERVPTFVLVNDYPISGSSIQLPHLAQRLKEQKWDGLSNEEQTIKIILDTAQVDLDEVIKKGDSDGGRTTRSYDLIQASHYLTESFRRLWEDKDVRFDLRVDGPTFNVFVQDAALGMPVRLSQRSTGFRWYVSFAWRFTHATKGQFKGSILLLEEPGIHLHPDAQERFVEFLDKLAKDNQVLYTTHLPHLIDPGFPERVRIVERDSSHHTTLTEGVVSRSGAPMLVIEGALGISHSMSALLESRRTLIVEGSMDDQTLRKLSSLCARAGKACLPDDVHIWPADTASKTPMYAAFLAGHGLKGAVLLDTDVAGAEAAKKIEELLHANPSELPVLMLAPSCGSKRLDFALEDMFPSKWYIDCVEAAYGIRINKDDLEGLGNERISAVVDRHLKARGFQTKKKKIAQAMLASFEKWSEFNQLPAETQKSAEHLFERIRETFNRADTTRGT